MMLTNHLEARSSQHIGSNKTILPGLQITRESCGKVLSCRRIDNSAVRVALRYCHTQISPDKVGRDAHMLQIHGLGVPQYEQPQHEQQRRRLESIEDGTLRPSRRRVRLAPDCEAGRA